MNQISKATCDKLAVEVAQEKMSATLAEIGPIISRAKTFSELAELKDRQSLLNAYLKTSKAAKDLGAKVDLFRRQAAELAVEADLRLSKLARDIPTNSQRVNEFRKIGVKPSKAEEVLKAGTLPEKQLRGYFRAKKSEGTLPETREVARLAQLDPPSRKEAFAKMGDSMKVSAAINAMTSGEPKKPDRPLRPVTAQPASQPTEQDRSNLIYAKVASGARELVRLIVSVSKPANELTTKRASAVKLLMSTSAEFDSKWKTFCAILKELNKT